MSTRSWIIVGGVAWMAGTALGVALCRAAKEGDQWMKDGRTTIPEQAEGDFSAREGAG
jgi:hypothetical protein